MTGLSVRGATVLRGKRLVLEDVSFTAPGGAVTAVLGNAGAGKTSLLAAVAGLLKLERGAVLLDGADVTRLATGKRGLAFLPPGSVLPEGNTVQAGLKCFAGGGGLKEAVSVAGQLGASGLLSQDPALFSHGEAALALTAARLARSATVILLDEAGAGLDEVSATALHAVLRLYAAEGRVVVLATRSPSVALRADQLLLLEGGRLLQAGTPASAYAEPRDAACALLTGPANILAGHVRELRAGGFVWAAGGRFVQAVGADMVRPVLGTAITICLRPERIALLGEGERADNEVEAVVIDVRSAGALLHVYLSTVQQTLMAAVPSWGNRVYPAAGQHVRAGWSAGAAFILGG